MTAATSDSLGSVARVLETGIAKLVKAIEEQGDKIAKAIHVAAAPKPGKP